ncbi:hypothetical protein AGABI2DRAFT_196076, partial [Agaricus bisporus var. bisporus H97]|uniref:hypothetical protein n=1 Tax=Agaricus bisporus var. bisporus (strain H97 / ATCC MYA-4626 / FGSC 10389) TaxID=936046 RepID=UPI00029F74E6
MDGTFGFIVIFERLSEVVVKLTGKDAEIFVEDAKSDDDEEGEDEEGFGGDVPAREDDAGVHDVGVPEHTDDAGAAHSWHVVAAVVGHWHIVVV